MEDNRKYVAISIKHTIGAKNWKFGEPCVLWGFVHTRDWQDRCFSGYTEYLDGCELYCLGDFKKHGYGEYIKDDEPVKMSPNLCKNYKKYDTVLMDADEYRKYCEVSGFEYLRDRKK